MRTNHLLLLRQAHLGRLRPAHRTSPRGRPRIPALHLHALTQKKATETLMLLERLYDDDLAHASYIIGCQRTGEAIVVDPRRDIQV